MSGTASTILNGVQVLQGSPNVFQGIMVHTVPGQYKKGNRLLTETLQIINSIDDDGVKKKMIKRYKLALKSLKERNYLLNFPHKWNPFCISEIHGVVGDIEIFKQMVEITSNQVLAQKIEHRLRHVASVSTIDSTRSNMDPRAGHHLSPSRLTGERETDRHDLIDENQAGGMNLVQLPLIPENHRADASSNTSHNGNTAQDHERDISDAWSFLSHSDVVLPRPILPTTDGASVLMML